MTSRYQTANRLLSTKANSIEIYKNSVQIQNSGLWIKYDKSCGIIIKRIAQNKPIAIGLCGIRFRRDKTHPRNMGKKGINIRVVQELMGHADIKTMKIYTHVMEKDISVVQRPLDGIRQLVTYRKNG